MGAHADPVASVVAGLAVLLLAAKLGGELATRVKQPAVLGELLAGIVLGNLSFEGFQPFRPLAVNETIEIIAGIGALILLFEVGIESTVGQMLKVGVTSLLVAVLGVILPFALGWGVGAWLLPGASSYVHAFLGATLTATSVGITARVLQDLGASGTQEARIILGAAVIDDVLGLIILGAVSGAIVAAAQSAPFSVMSVAKTSAAAALFLVGALVIGVTAAPRLFSVASLLQVRGVLVTVSLSLCFLLAWASSLMGLAPIVGAFAAGLVLEDVHFKDFVGRGERSLEELIRPISDVLVPVFFVLMGLRTDLGAFASPGALELAAALIVVAIIGKQACALGVTMPGVNRLAVGIGMIPRGEVGLIFASVGAGIMLDGQPLIGPSAFAAIVLMVIVTTLVTPPALKVEPGPRARTDLSGSGRTALTCRLTGYHLMKKLSGWQKVGLFAGIGCFSVVAIVLIGIAIAVAYARSTLADLGDTTPTRVERAIVIQAPTAEAPAPGSKPDASTADEPMRLRVELQEGSFDIKPGPPGGRVQVEGEFSEALYELTERTDTDTGKPRTTIRFRSKAPAWARFLGGMGSRGNDQPRLTVSIPPGVPIDLSLSVTMGESRIDLGGLTLSELALDLSMGNHEVDFREPMADGLQRLRLKANMGNVSMDNLGNARAKSIDASGSMGNVTADLGGEWRQGSEAELSFTQSMGEVRVKVPTKVRLEADVRDSEGQRQNVPGDADQTTDPKAPLLRVRVSTSMGESRVTRY